MAFTLAEVLITLGIIGIIAALTITGLMVKYQKKVTAVRLKQTYTQLYQAINLAQSKYGQVNEWGIPVNVQNESVTNPGQPKNIVTGYADKIIPSLKIISKPEYVDIKKRGYGPYYNKSGSIYIASQKFYITELVNGATLFFGYNGDSIRFTNPTIFIDINGKAKPNITGRDLFLFEFIPGFQTFLRPIDHGYSREYLLKKCAARPGTGAAGANFACGALIMLDGWEIKDDHPW